MQNDKNPYLHRALNLEKTVASSYILVLLSLVQQYLIHMVAVKLDEYKELGSPWTKDII